MSSLAFYKDKDRTEQIFCQFPVGFIYLSMIEINPSELLGGTWEKISGVFLLACSDKYPVKSTGGEETHKLTIDEIPSHKHRMGNALRSWASSGGYSWPQVGENNAIEVSSTENTGGDKPHNNMPPYLAVYMYQRTA